MVINSSLGGGAGGKTPFGARTPGRTPAPGHATPGHMSVRQVGRTPNPYGPTGMPPPPVPGAGGVFTPSFAGYPRPQQYGAGFQTPGYGQQPPPGYGQPPPPGGGGPPGVHPSRAAMIQGNGWGHPY